MVPLSLAPPVILIRSIVASKPAPLALVAAGFPPRLVPRIGRVGRGSFAILRPFTTLRLAPPQIVAQRLDKALVPSALVAGNRLHIVSAQTRVDSGDRGREQGKVGKYPDLFHRGGLAKN